MQEKQKMRAWMSYGRVPCTCVGDTHKGISTVLYTHRYRSAINICVGLNYESLPDRIIILRTNFNHAKLLVKRIFLIIQSHNLKSHKV